MKKWHIGMFVGAALVFLVACSPSYEQKTFSVLPEELKDCKFFQVTDGNGTYLYVTRCPLSQTSTTLHAKRPITGIVIED